MTKENEPKKKSHTLAYVGLGLFAIFSCGVAYLAENNPAVLNYSYLAIALIGGGAAYIKFIVPAQKERRRIVENNRKFYQQNPDQDPKIIRAKNKAESQARKAANKEKKRLQKRDKDFLRIASSQVMRVRDNRLPSFRQGDFYYNDTTASYQTLDRFVEWHRRYGILKK